MSPHISLCLIARDEAAHIERCLNSVARVVHEMIVADTGSVDDTADIARRLGARVFSFPWRDDFAAARNATIERAKGEWILVLDADEELTHDSRTRLSATVQEEGADAFRLTVESPLPAGNLQSCERQPMVRLFRNHPRFRYGQAIHEQIQPAILAAGGTIRESALVILHHGYLQRTVQGGQDRMQRNLAILEREVARKPGDPYLLFHLGSVLKSLNRHQEAGRALERAMGFDHNTLPLEMRAQLFMKLAQLALDAGDNLRAQHLAAESLALDGDNLVSLYCLALALMFQGKRLEGCRYFLELTGKLEKDGGISQDLSTVLASCRALLKQDR